MKLISELVQDVNVITEGAGDKKSLYIEGYFIMCEQPNRNKRIYPKAIMEREVDRYRKNYITENRAFGELNHPATPTINLDRVSHVITSLTEEGNNYVGKAKILSTPCGKIVEALISDGVRVAVSTRGMGNLEERNGVMYVKEDFYLATPADIVADPSAPIAFVKGIMEGADWVFIEGQGWVQQYVEDTRKKVDEVWKDKEKREEVMLESFKQYMDALRFNL